MKKFLIALLFVFMLAFPVCMAQDEPVDLLMFHGQGCPHCAKLDSFLEEIRDDYPSLNVTKYEVYFNNDNRKFFAEMAGAFGEEIGGVPAVFIDGRMIVGFSDSIGDLLLSEIDNCVEKGCSSPLSRLDGHGDSGDIKIEGNSSSNEPPDKTAMKKRLTVPAVLGAAAVDAINPCAFAVLIMLITTILASGSRKKSLYAGFAFSLSIYISYFLMGLGLFSAIQASGITHTFFSIVAFMAILIGLFNLKDYLWYGKWFIMEVPQSWRPKLKAVLKGVTSVPGAFLIGFVISLFLLPCTSGPYIVILGLLAEVASRDYALILLLLYNFIFILPMLILTLIIFFGFTTVEKAEEWRKNRLKTLHLIAGIILIILGIGMLVAMHFGMI